MLGERLAELRKDKGWKQDRLAKELQVSIHTVMSWEQNKSDPDDITKASIAKLFNISLDYLLGIIDEELPIIRSDRIDLPKNFPLEGIPEVKEYMKLIVLKYKDNE